MKIVKDRVVTFDYTLTDEKGEELDSSEVVDGDEDSGPLTYLHGYAQILEGLEAALDGHTAGEKFEAVIPPAQGYGEASGEEPARVLREQLPEDAILEVGEELELQTPQGENIPLWITDVDDEAVYLSPDHPLAGVTLHFSITVRNVREATKEELEHGHVHGDGGVHH